MQQPQPELTPMAQRYLHYLRSFAASRERAVSDAQMSIVLGINPRDVIRLRDELVAAGHLVTAETQSPAGSWLLLDTDDLAPGYRYLDSLRHRRAALSIKCRNYMRALRQAEAKKRVESNGQVRLF